MSCHEYRPSDFDEMGFRDTLVGFKCYVGRIIFTSISLWRPIQSGHDH